MPPPTTPPQGPIEQYYDTEFLKTFKQGQAAAEAYLKAANEAGWRLQFVAIGYVIFERTEASVRVAERLTRAEAALGQIAALMVPTEASARTAIQTARAFLGLPPLVELKRLEE